MEVTARHVENIPRGNLRVSRSEFIPLWRAAEHLTVANPTDWYVAGAESVNLIEAGSIGIY
jgi:hypothetical protein